MTDAERLVEINARHWMVGGAGTVYPEQCVCGLAWPCDAAFLLAELAHCEQADADSLAEVERLRGVMEATVQERTDLWTAIYHAQRMASLCTCSVPGGGECPRCEFERLVRRLVGEPVAAPAELEGNP